MIYQKEITNKETTFVIIIKFIFVLCLLLYSCNSIPGKIINNKYENIYKWNLDSTGCIGLRHIDLFKEIYYEHNLEGKKYEYVLEALGEPDKIKPSKYFDGYFKLVYNVNCICDYPEGVCSTYSIQITISIDDVEKRVLEYDYWHVD